MAKKETKKVAKKVTKKEVKKETKAKTVKKAPPEKKVVKKEVVKPQKTESKSVKKQETKKAQPKKVDVMPKKKQEPKQIQKLNQKQNEKPLNVKLKTPSSKEFRELIKKGEKSGMLGVFSDDQNRALDANISMGERQYNDYHTLVQAKRNGDIVRGTVIGVKYNDQMKQLYVEVRFNTIIVKIFEKSFFEKDFFFGKSYMAKPEDIKRAWRKTALLRYQWANICFKVIGNEDHIEKNGPFKDERVYTVYGDRCAAMDTLKDIYFFHRNRKDTKLPPREVKIGNSYPCNIVDVTFNDVTVECCGVETRIKSTEISNNNVINCFESDIHVGDVKNFYVKSLTIKDNKIDLKLSGRTMTTPVAIKYMKKGDTMTGVVIHYNEQKDNYTILLGNEVTASVYRNNVQGYSELAVNDKVSVMVTEVRDTFVVGNCVKVSR